MDGLFNQREIMTALEMFRKEKDEFFKKDQNSPLSEDQRVNFEKLKYFPENSDLRFEIEMDLTYDFFQNYLTSKEICDMVAYESMICETKIYKRFDS